MRDLNDWADRKYKPHGHVAHIVPFGQPYSLCGAAPMGLGGDWYGTGDMDEIEKAASLPTCGACVADVSDETSPSQPKREGQ